MKTRIAFAALAVALALLPACNRSETTTAEAATPEATRPSVLLITLDTTRADRLGVYGNDGGATPRIDALASEGVVFRRAFCHTPLTIPSHVSIFTGQYPDRHGVRDNGDHFLTEDATTLAERFDTAGYATAASVGAYVTNHKWGFGQGFDDYYDHIEANYELTDNVWQSERRGDKVVADMVGWLEEHADESFFAWVHLFDPHHPYTPPAPFDETFAKRPYLGEIAYTDHQVGVLLDTLERLGVGDRTAVVIAGDHGESFGNHKEHQHGIFVYNATTHVPLILRPAGGTAPQWVEEAVGLIDVSPTVLGLAGLEADAADFDGIDLSGTVDGEQPPRRAIYGESMYARYHFGWSEQRMIVQWPYKYIGSTRPELFEIDADAKEHDNLAESLPDKAAELAAILDARPSHESSGNTSTIDPETAARLEALGYVATQVEVEEGAVLPDPKDKTDVLARFARGTAAMRTGNADQARKLYEEVVESEPQLVDPRCMLAQICIRTGDLDEAIRQLDEADRMAPGRTSILSLRALALAVGGRTEEALLELERALAVDNQDARVWTRMLEVLFEQQRYDEVVAKALEAEAVLPGVPAVASYRGAALVAMGKPEEARPVLEASLAGGHNPPWANFAFGVVAAEEGDAEASLGYFLAEYGVYPEHRTALYSAVMQLEALGRSEEVLHFAHVALTTNSAHIGMQRAHAQALFNLERYDEALVSVNTCVAIEPDEADCTMLLANVLAKLGRTVEGEEAFERAVELKRQQLPVGASVEGRRVQ